MKVDAVNPFSLKKLSLNQAFFPSSCGKILATLPEKIGLSFLSKTIFFSILFNCELSDLERMLII